MSQKIKTPLIFWIKFGYRPVAMWWHTRWNQISSFDETGESI